MKEKRVRKLFITGFCSIGVTVLLMSGCVAQTPEEQYPARDITFVVGWNPGGGSDTWSRVTAAELEKKLPVSVVVINVPGSASLVGLEQVMGDPPDGYKISIVNAATAMSKALGMAGPDPKDPSQVAMLGSMRYTGYFLGGRADAGCESLQDFINKCKASQEPITVCAGPVAGSESLTGFVFLDLLSKEGVKFNLVSFEGIAPCFKELLAGKIQFAITDYSVWAPYLPKEVDPQLRMKLFAISSEGRHPLAEDVPTFRELGYDVVVGTAHGLAIRPDTPEYIIDYLTKAYEEVANSASYTQAMDKVGRYGQKYLGPDESAEEYRFYANLAIKLADAGILKYHK